MNNPIVGKLSAYAREIGIHHVTLAKRLAAANIHPCDEDERYALRDVLAAMEYANKSDPTNMTPVERRVWYDSELKRLKLEVEEGTLVAAADAREEMGRIVSLVINNLSTFADVVERDLAADPETIVKIEAMVNDLRTTLAQELEK